MIFSIQIIKELLQISAAQRHKLNEVYKLMPATQCQRRSHCCSLLPEMTLVEALAVIQQLVNMAIFTQKKVMKKIISYFFLNPVEITMCPFLKGKECLIYQDRFFGCRTYGLWSREYYEKLASSSRHAKEYVRKQWKNLGVLLPRHVIDFQVPYCLNVKTINKKLIDDKMLLGVGKEIEELSHNFSEWHQIFRQTYFSDLSFLMTSLVLGVPQAVQMKFTIISDVVKTGDRTRVDKIIAELPDLFSELT